MFATAPASDPVPFAQQLANGVGGQLLDAVIDVLPVVVPFLVAAWALSFVWGKVQPGGGSGGFYADTLGTKARGYEQQARTWAARADLAEQRGDFATAARYASKSARAWDRSSEASKDAYYSAGKRQRRKYDRQMARGGMVS